MCARLRYNHHLMQETLERPSQAAEMIQTQLSSSSTHQTGTSLMR